jgi:hypothetical protein
MDSPAQKTTMTEALATIGESLKSEPIRKYLSTGDKGSFLFCAALHQDL